MARPVRGWPLVVLLGLLAGCPGSSVCTNAGDGGVGRTVRINGRVVDFETCLTKGGCRGLAGVRVALFLNSAVVSGGTSDSGAFTLAGVPDGARHFLHVTGAPGSSAVLPSLNAEPVTTQGTDLFGVELFALRSGGGLYGGIRQEAAVEIATHALYLGQVLSIEGGAMKAIDGVTIHSSPAADVRYVNCIPAFSQCAGQPTLGPAQTATGVFGEFVLISKSGKAEHTIWATGNQQSYNAAMVPLGTGYITIGLHRSTGAAPPPTDVGLAQDGGP
jgi:hypothetical protein